MAEATELTPIARALGRIPSGLYLVTTEGPEGPLGFVGSFVMQVGFEPPTVCVAIGHGRTHLEAIRSRGRFAVSILDAASQDVMGHFFRKLEPGESPFDQVEHEAAPSGSPVVTKALAWLDCRLSGEHDAGDHAVVFGVVEAAHLTREGDPSIHLRKNGLGY